MLVSMDRFPSLLLSNLPSRFLIQELIQDMTSKIPHDHLLLDSVPNLGPLIYRWEINKFENC